MANLATPALAASDTFTFGPPPLQGRRCSVHNPHHRHQYPFYASHFKCSGGEVIRFIVTNKGRLTHEFVIGDAKEQTSHESEMQSMPGMSMPGDINAITLKSGETKTLVWTFSTEK